MFRRWKGRAETTRWSITQPWNGVLANDNVELVAKHGVLDDQLVPGTTRVSGEPRELASGAAKVESRPESAHSTMDPFRHSRNREQPHLAIRPRVAVEAADNLEFQLRLRADAQGSQHGRFPHALEFARCTL